MVAKMNPILSFVVPVYNTDNELLKSCIDSLINQECDSISYEIILVDNGTNEENKKIIKHYRENFEKKIKSIFIEKNMGFAAACNKGLSNVCGKYVYFVDSDDLISGTLVRDFQLAVKEDQPDVIFVNSWVVDKSLGTVVDPINYNWEILLSNEIITSPSIDLKNYSFKKTDQFGGKLIFGPGQVWNKIFSKSFLEENKLKFNEKLKRVSPDVLFSLTGILNMNKFSIISKPGYFYRNNVSQGIVNTLGKKECDFYLEGIVFLEDLWILIKNKNLTFLMKKNIALFMLMYALYLYNLVHINNKEKLYSGLCDFFKQKDVDDFIRSNNLPKKWIICLYTFQTGKYKLFSLALKIHKLAKKFKIL